MNLVEVVVLQGPFKGARQLVEEKDIIPGYQEKVVESVKKEEPKRADKEKATTKAVKL